MRYDVIIVGGGAAGLCAAYAASQTNQHLKILVLEKESVCGRKLSASGNGKGNLTNSSLRPACYHSYDRDMIKQWVSAHSYEEVIAFFDRMGILLYEKNGYYYPVSNQAKQVTELLVDKCRQNGVVFVFNTEITAIAKAAKQGYILTDTSGVTYEGTAVILSTGGAAAPQLGGSKTGYQLAKKLQCTIQPVHSVLQPIYVTDPFLKLAKGVRLDGTVTLQSEDGIIAKESGQIQWNEDNLSGIVMMNLSCYLPYQSQDTRLLIDLLPDYSWDALKEYINKQCNANPDQTIHNLLLGIFPAAMVRYLLQRLRIGESLTGKEISEKQCNRITSNIKKLCFQTLPKDDNVKAQATSGGVALSEIDITTMESKKYPDLYLAGELLDVNGCCGGYNLTFAMLSGIQATQHILKKRT